MFTKIKPLFKNGRGCLYYLCQCPFGYFQKVRIDVIESARCCECILYRYQKEAENAGVELIKTGENAKGIYKLHCGCEKAISYSEVREKVGLKCYTHDIKRSTFLYAIKMECNGFSWIKLGVTTNTLKARVTSYGAEKNTLLRCLAFHLYENRQDAFNEETRLSKKYKHANLDDSSMNKYMKNGFTECYDISIEGSLIDEIAAILY